MIPLDVGPVPSQVVSDAAHADPFRPAVASRVVSRSPVGRKVSATVDDVAAFLRCVIRHESANAGTYTARNPTSTASGAYQFIDGTWRSVSRKAGHPGWARAYLAPPAVQDAVARWLVVHNGHRAWKGTHCGYGT